jgi:hypothetical protein
MLLAAFLVTANILVHYEMLRLMSAFVPIIPIAVRFKVLVVVLGCFVAHTIKSERLDVGPGKSENRLGATWISAILSAVLFVLGEFLINPVAPFSTPPNLSKHQTPRNRTPGDHYSPQMPYLGPGWRGARINQAVTVAFGGHRLRPTLLHRRRYRGAIGPQ